MEDLQASYSDPTASGALTGLWMKLFLRYHRSPILPIQRLKVPCTLFRAVKLPPIDFVPCLFWQLCHFPHFFNSSSLAPATTYQRIDFERQYGDYEILFLYDSPSIATGTHTIKSEPLLFFLPAQVIFFNNCQPDFKTANGSTKRPRQALSQSTPARQTTRPLQCLRRGHSSHSGFQPCF